MFFKAPEDNSGDLAFWANEVRNADMNTGRRQIDSAFSRFDDDYFNQISKAYVANFMPQLNEQFGEAKGAATKSLAARGLLNSSIAAKRFGKIAQGYQGQRSAIASQGVDSANDARASIESNRARLFGDLQSAISPADAQLSATQAAA